MAVLNDCVCQHVGYCDGSCQHPEPLAARLSAAYEKVAAWPENRMTPNAVEELGEGFTDLLKLRNLVPDVLAYLSSTSAGVTEEQAPRVTDAMVEAACAATVLGEDEFGKPVHLSPAEARCALEASRVAPVSQKEAVAKYPLATFGHADVLPLGIYRIHWKSGGSSLAAVGMMENGDRWLAPTNWTAPNMDPTNEWSWGDIDRAEPIPSPAPAVEPVGIKALEWTSEPPYSVARPFAGMHYATEVIWPDNGGRFDYVLLSGPTIGSKRFASLSDAKAAAQAHFEARIRSALHPSPTPVSAPVGVVEALRAYHSAYSDLRFAPDESWERADASGRMEDAHDQAKAVLAALRSPAVEGK